MKKKKGEEGGTGRREKKEGRCERKIPRAMEEGKKRQQEKWIEMEQDIKLQKQCRRRI